MNTYFRSSLVTLALAAPLVGSSPSIAAPPEQGVPPGSATPPSPEWMHAPMTAPPVDVTGAPQRGLAPAESPAEADGGTNARIPPTVGEPPTGIEMRTPGTTFTPEGGTFDTPGADR